MAIPTMNRTELGSDNTRAASRKFGVKSISLVADTLA